MEYSVVYTEGTTAGGIIGLGNNGSGGQEINDDPNSNKWTEQKNKNYREYTVVRNRLLYTATCNISYVYLMHANCVNIFLFI